MRLVNTYVTGLNMFLGVKASIWKMHNWSGQLGVDWRIGKKKRSCGRPFSPDLIVRAGGNGGMTGRCCSLLYGFRSR